MATDALNGSEPDRAVDLHSSEVPPTIRAAVEKYYYPGCVLMRCPRLSESKSGLMVWFKPEAEVKIEWWLFDEAGELIEAFWDEFEQPKRSMFSGLTKDGV